jgi:hypothetical protein
MTPTTFHHAGLDWIPHTPGEPMPCPPDTQVRVLLKGELPIEREYLESCRPAKCWFWGSTEKGEAIEIIGWHPIEEQSSLARRVLDLLESGDIEQAKHELRKELE